MSVCRAHIVATSTQKSLGSLCVIRPFQAIQFTDFDNPAISDGFHFLLITTGEGKLNR